VILDAGRRVQVIEAAPRVGGRCYTDFASFGMPFDQGAMWLRDADHNPVFGYAQLYRFETALPQQREVLFANGRPAPAKANDAYERAYDALSIAMANAADEDADLAANAVPWPQLDDDANEWLYTAASHIGPLSMGADLEHVSVKDWFFRDEVEPMRLVRQGMGTLVARLANGLPVSISTSARRVSSGSKGRVNVETSRGTLCAKAVIITASVGVLAAGSIAIEPGLSSAMTDALSGLQMGSMLRIALAFDHNSPALKFEPNSMLLAQSADERGAEVLVRPFGLPLVVCTVGGSIALDLEPQSDAARQDFVVQTLARMIGSQAAHGLHGTSSSNWGRNPLTLGSVSLAKPGHLSARQLLQAPINERIFLAGEALAGKQVQSVHGAYDNGRQTARRVLGVLGRLRG
jgi:monoamine oxidase